MNHKTKPSSLSEDFLKEHQQLEAQLKQIEKLPFERQAEIAVGGLKENIISLMEKNCGVDTLISITKRLIHKKLISRAEKRIKILEEIQAVALKLKVDKSWDGWKRSGSLEGESNIQGKKHIREYIKWLENEIRNQKEIEKNEPTDLDFVKGVFTLHFYPQGSSGVIKVEKDEERRTYTLEKYFDIELKNWEEAIGNAPTKKDKLQAARNAILKFRQDWFDYEHKRIIELKERCIKHLYHIIEYINGSYEELEKDKKNELNELKIKNNKKAFNYIKKGIQGNKKLTIFRKNLADSDFIDRSTPAADFKAVFKNKQPLNLIRWNTNISNITELSYLIKQLHNKLKLVDNVGYDKWKITSKCFVDIDGNTFDWKRFRRQHSPKEQTKSELDKILSKL